MKNTNHSILRPDFSNISDLIDVGFSDSKLYDLCDARPRTIKPVSRLLSSIGRLIFPTKLFWPSECYGFGKCYRHWLCWPSFLPIPVYSDHGADGDGRFYIHELANPAKYHFCFSFYRRKEIRHKSGKKRLLRVQHPWITYRHSKHFELHKDSNRCLIFLPHSIPGVDIAKKHIAYSDLIENTRARFPHINLALCIHKHDVNAEIISFCRSFNLPVFTLGDPMSPLFVDRFYNLARNFCYASSSLMGSQGYYCSELGIDYHILGDPPTLINKSHGELSPGIINTSSSPTFQIEQRLFKDKVGTIDEQAQLLRLVLGIGYNRTSYRRLIRRIFIAETLRLYMRRFLRAILSVM